MKKSIFSICFTIIVAMWVYPSSGISQPKYGGTLVFGIEEDILGVDAHKSASRATRRIVGLYSDGLVGITKDYNVSPSLATSWEQSKNRLEYTFHLRKGVKFHNGRELTAQDIKFNVDRIKDPKTAAIAMTYFTMIDSVKVIDRYSVKFILSKPCGAFLTMFGDPTTFIIAPECVDKDGKVTKVIGTGPYEFVEWKPNEYVKFKKFKDYWVKGIPYTDDLMVKVLLDPVVRLNALKSKDVDLTHNLAMSELIEFKKNPQKDFSIQMNPTGGAHFISMNLSKPPFNDVRVRKALAYGINKKEMLQAMYQGYGEVVNQLFMKGGPWYLDVPDFVQDKERAKALLKEAYPNGVEVRLAQVSSSQIDLVAAQVMQEQLKDVGFKVEFDILDMATVYARARSGEFMARLDNFGPILDPYLFFPRFFIKNASYHRMVGNGYDNPRVNELLDKAGISSDYNERKKLYTEAARIIFYDDVAIIFTIQSPLINAFGMRNYVKGFQAHPEGWLAYPKGGFPYTWIDK
jgi:ABC-type transport system substrate-binding protein